MFDLVYGFLVGLSLGLHMMFSCSGALAQDFDTSTVALIAVSKHVVCSLGHNLVFQCTTFCKVFFGKNLEVQELGFFRIISGGNFWKVTDPSYF